MVKAKSAPDPVKCIVKVNFFYLSVLVLYVFTTFALESYGVTKYSLVTFLPSVCILMELLQSQCVIFYCVAQYGWTRGAAVQLAHHLLTWLRNIPFC